MSIKKSIGWTDKTINPIKGMCKGGCWYCWTKPFYVMKRLTPEIRLDLTVFSNLPKISKRIFLCSTHDLFGDWISITWRDLIFDHIGYYPQHTFQILTKFPQNIDREMPGNVHLGISVGDNTKKSAKRIQVFIEYIKRHEGFYFLSIEPFIYTEISYTSFERIFPCFGWIILGRLTGHGKKYDPPIKHIDWIVYNCEQLQIPIFLKDNLIPIMGKEYVMNHREFPND